MSKPVFNTNQAALFFFLNDNYFKSEKFIWEREKERKQILNDLKMRIFSRESSDDSQTNLAKSTNISDINKPNVENKSPTTTTSPYPKYVFLIILMDLCERFSFYGFRNVIYVYLSKFISMDSVTATAIYHAFSLVCNFTPIFG